MGSKLGTYYNSVNIAKVAVIEIETFLPCFKETTRPKILLFSMPHMNPWSEFKCRDQHPFTLVIDGHL